MWPFSCDQTLRVPECGSDYFSEKKPTSVGKAVATLKSDVLAILRHCSDSVIQSHKCVKCLTTAIQGCVNVASASIMVFFGKLPLFGQ